MGQHPLSNTRPAPALQGADELPLLASVPWWFRLAAERIERGARGGYALLRLFARLGLLRRCAPFPLDRHEPALGTLQLPLYTTGLADAALLEVYERDAIAAMVAATRAMPGAAVGIDCGADVGVYSRLLLARGARLARLIAIEPLARSHAVLAHNLRGLDLPVETLQAGVAATPGRGELRRPDYDDNDRALFMEPGVGELPLHSIDSLSASAPWRGQCVALKIDVEGLELAVIDGARATLAAAPAFVVQFEAHPAVARRTGQDPVECLEALIALGARSWTTCEEGAAAPWPGLRPGRPFFEQLPDGHIYDVVVTSLPTLFADRA